MKCLTLTQPWATLVAFGEKRVETRSWHDSYRGRLAIHAAKDWKPSDRETLQREPFKSALARLGISESHQLPRAVIVGTVELVKIAPIDEALVAKLSAKELALGGYGPGRYAWGLRDARPLKTPILLRGRQGLYFLPGETSLDLEAGLRRTPGIGETICRHCFDPNGGGHMGEPCPSLLVAPLGPPPPRPLARAVNLWEAHDVYCGRAGKGQDGYWGNYAADGSIEGFEVLFLARVDADAEFRRRTLELEGKRLACPGNCKGRDHTGRCHVDVIARWVNEQVAKRAATVEHLRDTTDALVKVPTGGTDSVAPPESALGIATGAVAVDAPEEVTTPPGAGGSLEPVARGGGS